MTFEEINGTLMGQNLTYAFTYANGVTNDLFGILTMVFFFLVVSIVSLFMQFRFTGRIRPETSLLASSFVTLGFGIFLLQAEILSFLYYLIFVGIFVACLVWAIFSKE